jgi:CheY-like chemotaxis protein
MSVILVVDDEQDIRLVTRVLLELEGHQVLDAPDGVGALELLHAERSIQIVFLDLRMPGMSGWEVLAEMRREGLLDRLRVVVFTAHMEPRELQRAIHEGAHGYLTKPFTEEQLHTALEAVTQAVPG